MSLRIFSHFNIIKIVTHLEVMLQNVKKAKSDRSSDSDRSSGDYGTVGHTGRECGLKASRVI